jgi:hypothetical protein
MALWYAMVPSFWDVATCGSEMRASFWLTWYPVVLVLAGLAVAAAGARWCAEPILGGFSGKVRILFLVTLGFLTVVILRRADAIRDFRKEQAAYLDRAVSYLNEWDQRRQQLESELGARDHELSMILEQDRSTPHPELDAVIGTLRDEVEGALETLTNLAQNLDQVREQAAKIESARAHDFRAAGRSKEEYRRSLATLQPGAELLEFEGSVAPTESGASEAVDPLLRVEAVALAAQVVADVLVER